MIFSERIPCSLIALSSIADWYIPFFRVNKLRVLGDDELANNASDTEGGSVARSETEESTETEEYYDVDLDERGSNVPDIRKSWMELLSENLARQEASDSEGELPSLASYSTSSSSSSSGAPTRWNKP